MATQSRAQMFYSTAKVLNAVAARRLDSAALASVEALDPSEGLGALLSGVPLEHHNDEGQLDDAAFVELFASELNALGRHSIAEEQRAALQGLHAEFRWSEGRLMQASELLAEAHEARRKDLVALARMRRELQTCLMGERAYIAGQIAIYEQRFEAFATRESELATIVDAGAPTGTVVRELAAARAERKLVELSIAQAQAQIARIEDDLATLDHDVAEEAYDREPDSQTMRELSGLRVARNKAAKASERANAQLGATMQELGLDMRHGEIAAVGSFLASEIEGDARSRERMRVLRAAQLRHELTSLPTPANPLKAGLLHPVAWLRGRKVTTGSAQ